MSVLSIASVVYGDQFDTLIMPGKLISGHEEIEAECEKCHASFDQSKQDRLCLVCHDKIDNDMNQKKGYHGKHTLVANVECRSCHTDHKGRKFDIVLLDSETFDHDLSDYPLNGAHEKVACSGCHKAEELYRETDIACFACHKDDDVHKSELGKKCADCHDETSWIKAEFNHDETKFPLQDAHQDVKCTGCHPDERYKELPIDCNSCHKLNDVHGGSYGAACDDCHNERKWSEIKFDHDRDTDYPLKGGHKRTTCRACHQQDIHRSLDRSCVACHRNDDVHRGRYGKKCQDCHNLDKWADDSFNHDKDTDYPLNGEHASVACEACHRGNVHQELNVECGACHQGDDAHRGEQGEKCDDCHDEKSWSHNVFFNHDFSKFPLIGMHATTSCEECHLTPEYQKAPLDCKSCHEKDDVHKDKLGSECQQCHTPNHWRSWIFDHDKQTDYPLEGAHKSLDCLGCHADPIGDNEIVLATDCNSCHTDDDIHFGKFGIYCNRCHNLDSFDLEGTKKRSRVDGKKDQSITLTNNDYKSKISRGSEQLITNYGVHFTSSPLWRGLPKLLGSSSFEINKDSFQ